MKTVDINLLIYAINKDTPHHSKAKKWFEDSLSSDEPLGFAWIVILAMGKKQGPWPPGLTSWPGWLQRNNQVA